MAGQIIVQRGAGSVGGGSGTPGGASTQVQYNDGGVFGGDAGLVFDKTTDLLTADHVLLAQGTITDPQPNLEGAVTFNDAADTFTAWKLNVTDTNSHADSKLLDLQLGTTPRFDVRKDGYTRVRAVNGISPAYFDVTDHLGNLFFRVRDATLEMRSGIRDVLNSGNTFALSWAGTTPVVQMSDTGRFQWSSNDAGGVSDLFILRDAAGVLAQRNGTNAQAFRVYDTFSDASNYSRANLGFSSGAFRITTQGAGTGSAQNIVLETPAAVGIQNAGGTPLDLNAGRARFSAGGGAIISVSAHENVIAMGSTTTLSWGQSDAYNSTRDVSLTRRAASILALTDPNATGAAIELLEMTAPSAGASNTGRIFLVDNGSGKTRAMIQFASGAAVQFAIEP